MIKKVEQFLYTAREIQDARNGEEELRILATEHFDKYGVFPYSIHCMDEGFIFMTKDVCHNMILVAAGEGALLKSFEGEEHSLPDIGFKLCPTNNNNLAALADRFPFVKPCSHKNRKITLGLGDRLGLASAAHIRLLRSYHVFPVLAQQSIRELNLTGRTYEDVLAAASWDVFREGWTDGFGADGDHLKTLEEVKMAIEFGYTMITLDCSEHIDNSIGDLDARAVHEKYLEIPVFEQERLEAKYLQKSFALADVADIAFTKEEFERTVLVYYKATNFTVSLFTEAIKDCGRVIDFEMSIDETITPTTPHAHFFVTSELVGGGVDITSLAPRFCGEFQKGIDYRGDITKFEEEYVIHAAIAGHFGYKLSIHSGSDKFSVFPVIGRCSGGKYHVKTAGTNWLEAVRIIAMEAPGLFRRMYRYAMENLDAAKKYYHIGTSVADLPEEADIDDKALPQLLDIDGPRQLLHITYGLLLCARNIDGGYTFRQEFFTVLKEHEEDYFTALNRHIGKHLKYLGLDAFDNE